MPTTAAEIIRQALKKAQIIGEGQTPSNETLSDGLADFNDLIGQWNTQRNMIPALVDVSVSADGRVLPYSVGPGGDINVSQRPNRIDGAYLRQFTDGSAYPVDTPLKVWQAREQYSLATLKKNFVSYPSGVFLDLTFPRASLYVYPWPSAGQQYEVHLLLKGVFAAVVAATDIDAVYPKEYNAAMKFELARRFRQAYGKGLKPDPELNRAAAVAISTVKNANLQVPELMVPAMSSGGIYNIYSDGQ